MSNNIYERFTDRARRVLQLANKKAATEISPIHLLAGLLEEGGGVACKILDNLKVDRKEVLDSIDRLYPPGASNISYSKCPQDKDTKWIIEYSVSCAINLKHNYVGTEHLLCGILSYCRKNMTVINEILVNKYSVNVHKVIDEIIKMLEISTQKPNTDPDNIFYTQTISSIRAVIDKFPPKQAFYHLYEAFSNMYFSFVNELKNAINKNEKQTEGEKF